MGRTDRVEILLADDDPVVRAGYAKKVRAHGWSLTLAADGFEAMQSVRNGDFDVLLLDLKMPYRNGADVLRILRQEGSLRETRVFLLAEPGDSDLVEQAMREGADGVFDKSQMGPRDVISELQVMFHSVGKRRGGSGANQENVPDDVAKMANRFRKGSPSPPKSRGPTVSARHGPPPMTDRRGESPLVAQLRAQLAAQAAQDAGQGQGTAMVPHAHPGEPPGAPPAPPPGPPHPGGGTSYRSNPRGTQMAPGGARPPQAPPPPSYAGGPGSIGSPGGMGAPGNSGYDRPPPYDSFGGPHGNPMNPGNIPLDQPGPPTAEPLPNEPCFDTVLNKMVGEASRLAQHLGLPPDFSCPVCRNTLILRLWPEPGQEATVVGHFFCPGCTRT